MYKLYSDVNLQNKIRENAYNEIQTNWSWKTKINEIDSYYNQVINKGEINMKNIKMAWQSNNRISKSHIDLEVKQVYCWVITKDSKILSFVS